MAHVFFSRERRKGREFGCGLGCPHRAFPPASPVTCHPPVQWSWKIAWGGVYSFARALITRGHRLGGSNNRNLFSRSLGVWKSNIEVLVGLVSSEASLLGLEMAVFLLGLHMVIFPCPHASAVSLWSLLFLQGHRSEWTSLTLTAFLSLPSSKILSPSAVTRQGAGDENVSM